MSDAGSYGGGQPPVPPGGGSRPIPAGPAGGATPPPASPPGGGTPPPAAAPASASPAARRGAPGAGDHDVVDSYAAAVQRVAEAEGALARVEDELFTFAQTVEANPQLRDRLADLQVGVGVKLEVVEGLLGGRAHPQTVSAVAWIVQSGRIRLLTEIARALTRQAAMARNRVVAEVHSAVDLTADQRERLTQALARTTGQQIETKVIVDPDVVGGLVVNLGDTVIDGSVARRLAELRARLVGA